MTSPLLALFNRALRDDTRAKSTYWARAGLAVFMLGVMIYAAVVAVAGGAPGLAFLQTAAWLQTLFLTITGLGWFASAITEEKEEDMLGLLRMTNLSPLSILLGKSTNRLCGALLLIVAQVPFTLLAVTLGGVSSEQVFAVYITLAAYAFLFCNLALLCSVVAPRTGTAVLATGALLFLGWAGGSLYYPLEEMSPFRRMEEIFNTGFRGPLIEWQLISSVTVGVGCFFLAWALFNRFCEGRSSSGALFGKRLQQRLHGRLSPGRPTVETAFKWKDFHFLHGGWAMVVGKAFGCVVLLGTAMLSAHLRGIAFSPPLVAQSFFYGLVWLIAEAGWMASRVCASEVRGRTLSSLYLLPQNLPGILREKVAGCWPALLPVLVFLGLSLVANFVTLTCEPGHSFENIVPLIGFGSIAFGYVMVMVYLGVSLTAYLSLRMKRGALALAIIICIVASVFAIIPLLGWYGVPIAAAILGHSFRAKTMRRLEILAAED